MSFAEDDDILQDFLVEAGEILEQLSEQLIDLEQQPDDRDLLNAIFRGFHTVKGGAGFLQLDAMVECCHVTENLFDSLRNGKRTVTAELMDVVLQALDAVNEQFRQVSQREVASPASPELLAALERLVSGEDLAGATEQASPVETALAVETETEGELSSDNTTDSESLPITDAEYQGFLDAINGSPAQERGDAAPTNDEIDEDEFEALLDQLHGKGKGPGVTDSAQTSPKAASSAASAPAVDSSANASSSNDDITDDEFEALLDQLHGSGKAPTGPAAKPSPSADSAASTPSDAKKAGESRSPSSNAPKGDDAISEDEFEALLDQLHGKGQGPSLTSSAAAKKTEKEPSDAGKTADKKEPKSEVSVDKPVSALAKPAPKGSEIAAKPAASPAKPAAVASANSKPDAADTKAPAGSGNAAQPEATVRVDTQRLDDIMNMVGELVLVRNRLVRLGLDSTDEVLSKAVGNLDVVTADLQTAVMKTRMQPIKKVFGRFPRVVRDLARNLKKEVNLELKGEDTDLDKNLVEALADPLVHLVRNAVDHGVESPEERQARGKPREGKVVLSAEQEGDHILLAISDDGGGMDPQALKRKAVEKGILDSDAASRLGDSEAFDLIFAPGFSTKTEISDVSGRGVGMDVVKTKITQLNGSITIQSKMGEGTRLAIKVPLTLAIMPTLMVMVGNQTFALPLVSVNEIFHLNLTATNIVDGQECVTVRDKAVPIFYLNRWLLRNNRNAPPAKEGHVVIVTIGTQRVGFVVDQLIGQEEVVIKPLGKMLHGTPGMAGATITGDGTIALILDVPGLLQRYAGRM